MDACKVLAELRQELNILNAAIASLERLQHMSPGEGGRRRQPARPVVKKNGPRAVTVRRKAS